MDKSKIAILTTLINKELYEKSNRLFPKGIDKYVIDGSDGMFGIDSICFMMEKLKGKGVEWLIMADEDVLFLNPDAVYSVIQEMKSKDYFVCGVRDGGVIPNRTYSPFLINTFFSILNFKELELIWNKKEVLQNQYINEGEFEEKWSELPGPYDTQSLYEPYYCFYFWLRRKNNKILFLDAEQFSTEDDKTTTVYDLNRNIMLYHTWYARSYGNNEKHTNRINKIFDLIDFPKNEPSEPVYFKDSTFFIRRKIKKINRRILNRFIKMFNRSK